jgi:outer membrane protein assembly factor BamB
LLAAVFAAAMLGGTSVVATSWERFHGDGANTGFVDVATARAGRGSVSVPALGKFAPGAGPAIAKDGTVYLGTYEGRVIALRADGSVFWRREITPGQSIVASPALGADGSVYFVGVKTVLKRDHRDGKVITRPVFEATLHRFTSSGGWIGQMRFPTRRGEGPATSAPPTSST